MIQEDISRMVSDAVRSAADSEDYDTIDAIIDVLYATVIYDVQEYLYSEYGTAFSEGVVGVLDDSEPTEAMQREAVFAEIDGKDFEDRIREYMDEAIERICADEDYLDVSDTLGSKMVRLIETEGHRVRNTGTYDAGVFLSDVGYRVTKTWRSVKIPTTRDTHWTLDGTTKDINDYFETVNGRARFPGDFHIAEEDCNCLCYLTISVEVDG